MCIYNKIFSLVDSLISITHFSEDQTMQTQHYIAKSYSVTGQMGSFIYSPNPILSHLVLGVLLQVINFLFVL